MRLTPQLDEGLLDDVLGALVVCQRPCRQANRRARVAIVHRREGPLVAARYRDRTSISSVRSGRGQTRARFLWRAGARSGAAQRVAHPQYIRAAPNGCPPAAWHVRRIGTAIVASNARHDLRGGPVERLQEAVRLTASVRRTSRIFDIVAMQCCQIAGGVPAVDA